MPYAGFQQVPAMIDEKMSLAVLPNDYVRGGAEIFLPT
jgi:hypothetical protein